MSKGIDEIDVEAELESAFAELDSKIPDGYFESFSSKVAATLDREASMQTRRDDVTTPEGAGAPPISADTGDKDRDEHSGLHEIKALAQSARKRIKRRSSEHDVEPLLSTSSSALSAVVLPDPESETIPPEPILVEDATSSAAMTSLPAQRPSTGLPTWLYAAGGTALLAAAAAVALLVFSGDKKDEVAAKADEAGDAQAAAAVETDDAERAQPAQPAAPAASEPADEPTVAALEPEPEEKPAEEGVVADEADAELRAASGAAPARGLVRSRKESKAKGSKDDAPPPPPKRPDPDEAKKKRTKKERDAEANNAQGATGGATTEGSGDINDLLDQVTGEDPKKKQKEVAADKPDKKRLGTGDVRRAMGGLSGAIKRCQSSTGFLGRVSVKFSVAPNGKVGRVKASGGDAKANACVKSAVKGARFPSFEPPAMSFRYSFLLQD